MTNISMRFTLMLSWVSMTKNTVFERTVYQQSNEIIITLIKKYLNFRKLYFKLGPNMSFVALPLSQILYSLNLFLTFRIKYFLLRTKLRISYLQRLKPL